MASSYGSGSRSARGLDPESEAYGNENDVATSPRARGVTYRRAIAVLAVALAVTSMSSCASPPPTSGSSPTPSKISPTQGSGEVSGVVVASPSCPVERIGSPCPAYPVAGAAVVAYSGPRRVAATTTDGSGRFTLRLPLGSYVVTATNPGGYPSKASTKIEVGTRSTTIRLTLDSGIR